MPDLLDLTATRVRLARGPIHIRSGGQFVPGLGHHYRTRCGRLLRAEEGALLTTRPVTCLDCAPAAFGGTRDPEPPTEKDSASLASGSLGRTGQGLP
jgi:hypothetical protein